jgi:RNA polymerase sigma-70 factor (ECF subfamily)
MPAAELEKIYDAHAPALFRFLLSLLRNETDARDALQEIFIRIARAPGQLSEKREPRAYLIRLAHNLAIDSMRRRGARTRAAERLQAEPVALFVAGEDPDTRQFRDGLAAALGLLPPEQRSVVHLKLWENLTFADIAEALEISPNTAASRYRYGLDKLRVVLRPLYEEIK